MKKALIIAFKDIKLTFRDIGALIGSFLAPIVILFIFGIIYSGMSGGTSEISIDLLFVDQEHSERSQKFLENLSTEDVFTIESTVQSDVPGGEEQITEEMAVEMILEGDAHLALVYHKTEPLEDFPVLDRPSLTLYYDPSSSMESEITSGLIQRTAFMDLGSDLPRDSVDFLLEQAGVSDTEVGSTLSRYMDVLTRNMEQGLEAEGEGEGGTAAMMESMIDLKTEEVIREEVKSGNPFMANTVAGLIVMFLLFSVSYSAASLLKEQQEGTIRRLLMAPLKVDSIILGKFLCIAFVSLCQVVLMLIVAVLVFRVNVVGNFLPVLIMSVATVAATTSFGMVIASMAKSYEQISATITIIVLSMSGIGGSMFPRILMPSWMQDIGLLTINGWAIDGFLDALYYYNGAGSILGYGEAHNFIDFARNSEALVLFAFAIICGWVASRIFKKRFVQAG